MLLAIDTSTRYAGVALADDQRVIAARTWYSTANHTTELMPAVAQLLQGRATAVQDLEGVAVALGPGGFSALRVGVSVAKGLAAAGGLKIVGVGSLDLEAFPLRRVGTAGLFSLGGRTRGGGVGPFQSGRHTHPGRPGVDSRRTHGGHRSDSIRGNPLLW